MEFGEKCSSIGDNQNAGSSGRERNGNLTEIKGFENKLLVN
jgi:hypothetical protein